MFTIMGNYRGFPILFDRITKQMYVQIDGCTDYLVQSYPQAVMLIDRLIARKEGLL